jgi:hypothetical protein
VRHRALGSLLANLVKVAHPSACLCNPSAVYQRVRGFQRPEAATKGRPVLFHGTRHPASIAGSGMLLFATSGDPVVSFSRSPEVAAYWADVTRDDDEGRGAVFVFDRRSLAARYRLEPFHDPIWDMPTSRSDEMEERVWLTNIAIAPHLIGFVEMEKNPATANHRAIAHRIERCSEHPGSKLGALHPIHHLLGLVAALVQTGKRA